MIGSFEGHYFPPRSAAVTDVRVDVDDRKSVTVTELSSGKVLTETKWKKIKISDRIGNIPRRLTLPDKSVVETLDNDTVDSINRQIRLPVLGNYLHRMEGLSRFTLVAVVLLSVFSYVLVSFGLPAAAKSVAFALPPSLLDTASEGSVDLLDRLFFEPTQLTEERRKELTDHFAETMRHSSLGEDCCQLMFRDGGSIGPNALALPDGTIILTDQLVELSTDDRGLIGVFAHEIGHVQERHSMRSLLQSSALALIIILVTGDMAEISELALGLPVLLVESGYSREFEREADSYAAQVMQNMGHDTAYLADLFDGIKAYCQEETKSSCESGLLSTHPDTDERAMLLRKGAPAESE